MKDTLLRLLCACCAGCSLAAMAAAAHAAAPPPLEIRADTARVPVWPIMRIVSVPDRQLTPEEAADLTSGSVAQAVDSPEHVLGRGTTAWWAGFSVANRDASLQWRVLTYELATQYDVRLFERAQGGEWVEAKSLTQLAAGRFGAGFRYPAWTLDLPPGKTVELLLRVEGPAVVRYPVFLYDAIGFAKRERMFDMVIGVALGIPLLLGAYVLTLRRFLNDASVRLFAGMLVSELVGVSWLAGFLQQLFPALPESILSPIGFAAYASLYGFSCLHARVYLNVAAWAPGVNRLLRHVGWFWLGFAPWFAWASPLAARLLLIWGGTAVALMLVGVSFVAARKKIPFSGFIAAVWATYVLSGVAFVLPRIVYVSALSYANYFGLVQGMIVATLFGFAMSQRLLQQRELLVAERQEAEVRRKQAASLMRDRSLLFAATNHDLRQPLLGVGLFADLLKSATSQAERDEYSRKLDIALEEVDGLLVGIQQLAAVHESAHSPTMETVALDALLAPVVEEYRRRASYKHVSIRYVPSRLSINTHVPYFQRIVRNVLSNAVRYTDPGGRILVGGRRAGGLCLSIVDTGHGMTEEQMHLAFDAFQRFDLGISIPDGFGLGLFSAKSLANALGLAISLHSEQDRGTEVKIFLHPGADAASNASAA
jgi:signal transduction histidine kinase